MSIPSRTQGTIKFIHRVGDVVLLNLVFFAVGIWRFDDLQVANPTYYNYYLQLLFFQNLSWLFLANAGKVYEFERTTELRKILGRTLSSLFLHVVVLALFIVGLKGYYYSRLFLVVYLAGFSVLALGWRYFLVELVRYWRRKGHADRRIMLVGSGKPLEDFYQELMVHPEYGLLVLGVYADQPLAVPVRGDLAAAERHLQEERPDEVFCSFPGEPAKALEWFKKADAALARFRILPDWGLKGAKNLQVEFYGEQPVLQARKEPLEFLHNRLLKRLFDVVFVLFLVVVVFPWLFPLLALLVKLSSPGPVFFKQARSGLRGEVFTLYKFRSMRVNADADLVQAVQGDARITQVGAFLRKHNLDELPQFMHVLTGRMSVVGPRPHMLAHTKQYRDLIDTYMVRHLIKPGLTGLAQVRGLRGDTTNPERMEERVKADVYYLENWSLLLDLKIVAQTFLQVFTGNKNAV